MALVLCCLIGDQVDELIERLADASWEVREEATIKLEERRGDIDARLKKALAETRDAEVRWRLERVLGERALLRRNRHLIVAVWGREWWTGGSDQPLDAGLAAELRPVLKTGRLIRIAVRGRAERLRGRIHVGEADDWGRTFEGEPNRLLEVEPGLYLFVLTGPSGICWREGTEPGELLRAVLKREVGSAAGNGIPPVFLLLSGCRGFGDLVPALRARRRETSDPFIRSLCEKAIQFQEENP